MSPLTTQLPPASLPYSVPLSVGKSRSAPVPIPNDFLRAELIRRLQARSHLLGFIRFTFADYEVNWHHRLICHYLDEVRKRNIRRLMIFTPPRHGKTEIVSFRFPAFVLGENPNEHVISASYNKDLAAAAGRQVQRIMRSEEYGLLYPAVSKTMLKQSKGSIQSATEFELAGFRGGYKCAGIGSGITGKGFNIGIIDDPFKDRKEADSPTIRKSVWDWYVSTFYTRRNRMDSAIVLIQTRWHHDDLAGRLLQEMATGGEQWTVLSLPALAHDVPACPHDLRRPGEALWPSLFSREAILDIYQKSKYDYAALYDQNPVPREGGLFKVSKLKTLPSLDRAEIVRSIRYWDKAGTEGAGCFTAGVLMHELRDRRIVVGDCVAGQWSALERERIIKRTALLDGRRVKIWCEQEPGSGGKESAEATIRSLSGYVAKADRVTGDKVSRAEPFAAQVEGGNVYLLEGDWNKSYIDELELFPAGKYRDRVDASSGAFNKLFFKRITPHVGSTVRIEEQEQNPLDDFRDILEAASSEEERERLRNMILQSVAIQRGSGGNNGNGGNGGGALGKDERGAV